VQIGAWLISGGVVAAAVLYAARVRRRGTAGSPLGATPRAVVTGQQALVTTAISPQAAGGITYSLAGERRDIVARSTDGTPVQAGTAVAIDRIEGEVAFVSVIP
jgi:hypothetical protein